MFVAVAFWQFKKKEHVAAFWLICFAFVIFLFRALQSPSSIPSREQTLCWAFAFFLVYMAFQFVKAEKLGEGLVVLFIAVGIFLCGLSAVQGLLKTGIVSKVNDSLVEYSKKLDGFQTNIEDARLEINRQQSNISGQYLQISNLQNSLQSAEKDIAAQFTTNVALQDKIATYQTKLEAQQARIENIAKQVDTIFANTENEVFSGSDSDAVIYKVKNDGAFLVCFKLKNSAVTNSVRGITMFQTGVQLPMLPPINLHNILICGYVQAGNSIEDFKRSHFSFEYVKDVNATEFVKTLELRDNKVFVDGKELISPLLQ